MAAKASGTTLRVMSGFVVRGAFEAGIVASYEERTGNRVEVDWAPTTVILTKLAAGDRPDVLLVTREAMDQLVETGGVDPGTRVELVDSRLGVAVARGAPHPSIVTPAEFEQALTQARSVAYSLAGASGKVFEALIERLGIADAVRSRATRIPTGLTAEKLVTGEADLAVQQVSELLMVPGIELVGRFPEPLQTVLSFSAAVATNSVNAAAATGFLLALKNDEAKVRFAAAGLDPI